MQAAVFNYSVRLLIQWCLLLLSGMLGCLLNDCFIDNVEGNRGGAVLWKTLIYTSKIKGCMGEQQAEK